MLSGRSAVADVVDVHVVATASGAGAAVITSDRHHLERVVAALPHPVLLFPV